MPRNDYKPGSSYKFHPGMIAWYLHRATGLFLIFYFLCHMLGSGMSVEICNTIRYNVAMQCIAMAAFAWHAFNGLRIIGMEFLGFAERGRFKTWLIVFSIIALIVAAYGIKVILAAAGA